MFHQNILQFFGELKVRFHRTFITIERKADARLYSINKTRWKGKTLGICYQFIRAQMNELQRKLVNNIINLTFIVNAL